MFYQEGLTGEGAEDGVIGNININPLQIESFQKIMVGWSDLPGVDSGDHEQEGVCVVMKSGETYDLIVPEDEFKIKLNAWG